MVNCSDRLRSWKDPLFAEKAEIRCIHPIPVAILSLADAVLRRQQLIARGLPPAWVHGYWPATDLRQAPVATVESYLSRSTWPLPDPPWPSSVVGCALSHGQAAHWQAHHKLPLMLVLEDDVIPASVNWHISLLRAVSLLLKPASQGSAFVCHLGPRPEQLHQTIRRPLWATRNWDSSERLSLVIDPRPTLWRGHAYLISWAAACRTGLPQNQLAAVADDWHRRSQLCLLDRVYVRDSPLFFQDEQTPSNLVPLVTADSSESGFLAQPSLARLLQSIHFRLQLLFVQVTQQLPALL